VEYQPVPKLTLNSNTEILFEDDDDGITMERTELTRWRQSTALFTFQAIKPYDGSSWQRDADGCSLQWKQQLLAARGRPTTNNQHEGGGSFEPFDQALITTLLDRKAQIGAGGSSQQAFLFQACTTSQGHSKG
jgi:hypothetical protein